MNEKVATSFRLDRSLVDAMRRVKAECGVGYTAQMELSLREWLSKRGDSKRRRRHKK